MSVAEENICARLEQESNQVSPFLQSIRFGEPSCTPSQQVDLLDVKDDYFKPGQVNPKVDISGENFLQYWGKQVENDPPKNQELPLEGPVGHILNAFEHEPEGDHSFKSHDSFDGENVFYSPHAESLEEFFDEAPKNFEEIIDKCSDDNCHFNNCIEEESAAKEKPTIVQKDNGAAEEGCHHSSKKKIRKRDAKMARKTRSGGMCFTKDSGRESITKKYHKRSLKGKDESREDLIIKIRSGSNVLATEKVCIGTTEKDLGQSTSKTEENKVMTSRSSCSTSTISNERSEEKSRRLEDTSVSFIELDGNSRIFCRSIGPLKANERKQKVLHYLEKKRSRKWHKRINYNTRKQVADIRPRYKGRFVTTEQFEEFKEIERKKNEEKLRQKVFKIERVRR